MTPARLKAGAAPPATRFTTLRGEAVDLAALRGQPLWLSFSRFAACPLCNFRVHEVNAQWSHRFGGTDLRHFMFFQSPAEKLRAYLKTGDPPFDLVADPEMDHFRSYAVELSLRRMVSMDALRVAGAALAAGTVALASADGPITRIPADFLIGRDGRIKVAHYGETIVDHIDLDAVGRFIAAESPQAAAG